MASALSVWRYRKGKAVVGSRRPPFTPFSYIVCAMPAACRARAVFPERGATLRVHDT
ncbi:hypothetical protein QFZ91_006278 [Paraburkholderia sp. JPY419]